MLGGSFLQLNEVRLKKESEESNTSGAPSHLQWRGKWNQSILLLWARCAPSKRRVEWLKGCFLFLYCGLWAGGSSAQPAIQLNSSWIELSSCFAFSCVCSRQEGSPTLFVLLKREVNWWMKEMEWSAAVIKHITAKQQRNPIFDWSEAAAEVNHSIHSFINKSKFNNFHFYLIDAFHFDGMKRLNKNVL